MRIAALDLMALAGTLPASNTSRSIFVMTSFRRATLATSVGFSAASRSRSLMISSLEWNTTPACFDFSISIQTGRFSDVGRSMRIGTRRDVRTPILAQRVLADADLGVGVEWLDSKYFRALDPYALCHGAEVCYGDTTFGDDGDFAYYLP